MATSFHLFPHLPWEIRSRIWELTIEPRTVDVRISHEWEDVSNDVKAKYNHSRLGPLRSRSSTPVPAPLQACREARSHLSSVTKGRYRFYQKAFSHPPAAESRYIWVNFDVDVVDTGDTPFLYFASHFGTSSDGNPRGTESRGGVIPP
ncbi:hypothetical protein NEUTE1DRAFT_39715 [Neurospora tetrasperma FGSC 2508]|uniref:2EXR domain-containing protein n=1 Tax=Neurospora tetrasperma (strain FGSC 2508 / ATCC MYA-4615 / P0657) TaxID=510951 RepID=F8MGL7_NEUT8|nr:uncharacterized protein NEUTE1DRAFT_39715 [Neurospora tetrasperma FGSC 2508]EGO58639.1 hypothetical protein NEUTE1DRAFT_39715 [Neurospora tetrasperma FGSC 2508]EGZ72719.1 hypothetical protein NEUTE2DRAFT_61863 [Neurospora tetrasperma FGSC 2509]